MNTPARIMLLASIVTAVGACAPDRRGTEEVTLRLRLEPNQAIEFMTEMDLDQSFATVEGSLTSRMRQRAEVLERTDEGHYRVLFSNTDVEVLTEEDSPLEAEARLLEQNARAFRYEAVFDDRGHPEGAKAVEDGETPRGQGLAWMTVGFFGVEYPEEPVRVGQEWTREVDLSKVMEGLDVNMIEPSGHTSLPITFRVSRIDQREGQTVVVVETSMKGTIELELRQSPGNEARPKVTLATDISGTIEIDGTDGVPLSSSVQGRNTLRVADTEVQQSMRTSMHRIRREA
jgi:hypothetical protein